MTDPRFNAVWIDRGDAPLPDRARAMLATFERDYGSPVTVWPGIDDRITGSLIDDAPNVGIAADVLRLEVLYQAGGVYIDCDIESLTPMTELLAPFDHVALKQGAGAGNHFIAAPRHSPLIREMLAHLTKPRIVDRIMRATPAQTRALTGPELLTRFYCSSHRATLIARDVWSRYMTHHQAGYWWRDTPKPIAPSQAPPPAGNVRRVRWRPRLPIPRPGDLVTFALSTLGVSGASGCRCAPRCEQMNRWGWWGCLKRWRQITGWAVGQS